MAHIREAGLCARGVRGWFKAHPELDMHEFLTQGLPLSQIEAMNDGLANRACAVARQQGEKS